MIRPDYQQRVADFVKESQLETDVRSRLLDLLSELGELAKESLKASRYGKEEFAPTAAWQMELADAFFSLVCLANSTGVDLDTALDEAIDKYRHRLSSHGDAGSGH